MNIVLNLCVQRISHCDASVIGMVENMRAECSCVVHTHFSSGVLSATSLQLSFADITVGRHFCNF